MVVFNLFWGLLRGLFVEDSGVAVYFPDLGERLCFGGFISQLV